MKGHSIHDNIGRLKHLTPKATHELQLKPVEKDFMVGWQLGKGSFGTVFVALSRTNRQDVRAVKVIDLEHADDRTITKLAAEVSTMRRVDHPNICARAARESTVETRGVAAAAATRIVRREKSRRRGGGDVNSPSRRVAAPPRTVGEE